MTPEQKRRRIAEIEQDVKQIMMQLHHIEYKVDSRLVRRDEMPIPRLPQVKMPSSLKKIWLGFLEEMRQEKSPR